MGLWDTLKSAVNSVTGGSATVEIEVGEATLGEPIFVRVRATAEADLEISAVYLLVQAIEYAEVRDVDYDFDDGHRRIEYVRGNLTTFNTRFELAEGQCLSTGESYAWEGTFVIPDTENPTFDGQMISHTWQIQAGLDAPGNDPDSGWRSFEVWDN
ncbi:MAG: hypothetical protein CMH52_05165 [Myxococcales bacterium]|nr:hypothetical protein [Myxococcales bacterium]